MYARLEKVVVDAFQKDYNWFCIRKFKPVPGQLLGLKEFMAMMTMNVIVVNLALLFLGFVLGKLYERLDVLVSPAVWMIVLFMEFILLVPMVSISFYVWNRADDGGRRGEY